MSLVLHRNDGESWKEAALRKADEYGLKPEVEQVYEKEIGEGIPPRAAAWTACYEWDILDYEEKD